MIRGAKAHYDGIVAFSQTGFTQDLKKIAIPVLVMHGDDDQIVSYADSGPLSAKLVQNGSSRRTLASPPAGSPRRPTPSTPTCSPTILGSANQSLHIERTVPTLYPPA